MSRKQHRVYGDLRRFEVSEYRCKRLDQSCRYRRVDEHINLSYSPVEED